MIWIGMKPTQQCVSDADNAADSTNENVFRTKSRYKCRTAEKGMVPCSEYTDTSRIQDGQDTNYGRAAAVQNPWRVSEMSDPVQLRQARTRRCGKIPAPLRGPRGDFHSKLISSSDIKWRRGRVWSMPGRAGPGGAQFSVGICVPL